MAFRITGLSPEPFLHLYGRPEDELAKHGVKRCVANNKPGFPDRIEMRDAEPGETLLLLNHVHQPANTPYRASHAIFVREGATQTYDRVDEVPELLRVRLLSLRAFDADGMMHEADVVDGGKVEPLIERLLSKPQGCLYSRPRRQARLLSGPDRPNRLRPPPGTGVPDETNGGRPGRGPGDQEGDQEDAAPTVSAMWALRWPIGASGPVVLSRSVWCSISAFNSAPIRTAYAVR